MNEPKRHHYIPQFILRNFCSDNEHKRLFYYDKKKRIVTVQEPKRIFMERDLYRDEINHPENPTEIEKGFAVFEREISEIINRRFLLENDPIINEEENEKLQLFLALSGFRSKEAGNSVGDSWKRNLGYLIQCRSIREVLEHPEIDFRTKEFMRRDVIGLYGRFISLVECRDEDEFVIGDAYPAVIYGSPSQNGPQIEMFAIYPISPKRVLLFPCVGVEAAPPEVRGLRECFFYSPYSLDHQRKKLQVRKAYKEETEFINNAIIETAESGIAFHSENNEKYIRKIAET